MRLQKWLALTGVGSRRACEKFILAGRIYVNGIQVTSLGTKIDPVHDKVTINRQTVTIAEPLSYYLFNKPQGFVTSLKDPRAGPTIAGLIQNIPVRVYPVGRLDKDAEGLILLTNDGELTNRLTHPRYKVWKTYLAKVNGVPAKEAIFKLRNGILLTSRQTAPAYVRVVKDKILTDKDKILLREKERSWLILKIREGRKHQVKRMLENVGHPVLYLCRIAMGPIHLGKLSKGEVRSLMEKEILALRKSVGIIS